MRIRLGTLFALLFVAASACTATANVDSMLLQQDSDSAATVVAVKPVEEVSESQTVYETIQDSIVYVLAPDGSSSGSGIVIEGNWILTNAHVAERYGEMRIGGSDGSDLGLHPVQGVDWVFDLALIGPVDDESLVAMERIPSADVGLGAQVLLVGFPDEQTEDPTPTVTEGILSRRRLVALGGYSFLQVDATIAPGQSGGALVDGDGNLIGISGLEFGQGEFGLAFEADAMWPRIDELLAAGRTELPGGAGVNTLSDEVGPLRNFGFTVEVGASGSLDLSASSDADIFVDVQTLGGLTVARSVGVSDPFRSTGAEELLYFDELVEGGEDVVANLDPGVYQVVIGSFGDVPQSVEVTSANVIRPFADVEEGAALPTGVLVEGEIDWPRDSDRWQLELAAGERAVITSDGIADVVITVRLDGEFVTTSDDEGLGLFGTGSRAEFVAEAAGSYTVEVGTFDQPRWGYIIEAIVS